MLDFISKTSSVLRGMESVAAKQAAEALDGALMAHAARNYAVMSLEEVSAFNDMLKSFLSKSLDSGKIPRGLKWRLKQLRDGQEMLDLQLERMRKQRSVGQVPMSAAEPPGEGSLEEVDVRLPESDLAPVRSPTEFVMLNKPAPLSTRPLEVKEEEPKAKPAAPVGTRAIEPLPTGPVGTHAETWSEKLKRMMGKKSSDLLSDLVKVADKLDSEGMVEAADIIDRVVVAASRSDFPGLDETRKDLYDFVAHNKETMHEVVKQEVEENRKQHHLKTHRGTAVSQTRYSPDMPGVMMRRLQDGVYQCPVTNKIYDFKNGYTDLKGTARSGGSISNQTPAFGEYASPTRLFEGAGALSRRK